MRLKKTQQYATIAWYFKIGYSKNGILSNLSQISQDNDYKFVAYNNFIWKKVRPLIYIEI